MGELAVTTITEGKAYQNPNPYIIAFTEGQKLEIKVGDDEMELKCPAGKKWSGSVHFHVREEDA